MHLARAYRRSPSSRCVISIAVETRSGFVGAKGARIGKPPAIEVVRTAPFLLAVEATHRVAIPRRNTRPAYLLQGHLLGLQEGWASGRHLQAAPSPLAEAR